jgi:hypothetical protein
MYKQNLFTIHAVFQLRATNRTRIIANCLFLITVSALKYLLSYILRFLEDARLCTRRRFRINKYKSRNNLSMKTNLDYILSRVYPFLSNGSVNTPHNILVGVEETRLQKILKLVTLYLEKQAHTSAPC